MGLDLDAIRKKLSDMSGNRINKLKIVDGKQFKLRLIAFPNNDGQPFKDRMLYSIGNNWNILAPGPDEPDPIRELTNKLRSRKDKSEDKAAEDWKIAKELLPSIKHHAIVIDRENESAGPMIWPFTRSVAKRLYEIFLDEDYGDITDIEQGFDIKVKRVMEDNGFRSYKIDPRPRQTPLSDDPDLATQWLDNLPEDIDSLYRKKTYDELDAILAEFLNGGEEADGSSDDTGTERGGSSSSDGDEADDDDGPSYESLDDAFNEIANSED